MIRCRMVRTEGTLDLPMLLLGFQRPRGRGPKSLRGICNLLAQCPHFAEGELRDGEAPGFGAVAGKSPAPDWDSRGLGSGHPQSAVEPGAAPPASVPSSEQGVGTGWSEVFRAVGTDI